MAFNFTIFAGRLDEAFVTWLVNEHALETVLHYEKLWQYYANERQAPPSVPESDAARPYAQAQEYGLPTRITGVRHFFYGGIHSTEPVTGVARKEVVIENDIAWRIDTMVDFLFGKPISLRSLAPDRDRAAQIETILRAVFDANGGPTFFQELALLGSIYGTVDIIVRPVPADAATLTLEIIEAPRSLPILHQDNYKQTDFYVQHYWQQTNDLAPPDATLPTTNRLGQPGPAPRQTHEVEILAPNAWQRYRDGLLIAQGANPLGVIPVVHIQNMVLPGRYEGQSDVEPLMPLQDELNTRLSDRANRIALQSFKMYLGRGITNFDQQQVMPGRMWSVDNPDAKIDEFGGDSGCPSENEHLEQVREALDKTSGVASVTAGILNGRLGNLTSAVALKVTLIGLLAKTQRKRRTYGRGIAELCRLILLALDQSGAFATTPGERDIEIYWPNPLPENVMERLQEAALKQQLGVPADQILREIAEIESGNG